MNVINFFNQFFSQLEMFEEKAESLNIDKKDYDDLDEGVLSLGHILNILIERKSLEHRISEEVKVEKDLLERIFEITDLLIENNSLARKIYETMRVKEEKEELVFTSDIPGLISFVNNRIEDDEIDLISKNKIELRSILINICISFESALSQMLKEYYLHTPNPILKDNKTITYKELFEIGDIETAKSHLIDIQLDELFRKKFEDWIKDIINMFSAKSVSKIAKEELESISEMYQRRHLFVHNDGIVNQQYLYNVPGTDYVEGDTISIDTKYVKEKIKDLKYVSWLLLDSYLNRHFQSEDEVFSILNSHLLDHINDTCNAIPFLFDKYYNSNKINEELKIIAKINYFIYYKINGNLSDYDEQLADFHTSHLETKYQVAKALLSDADDCLELLTDYIHGLDESEYFEICDWPIFKVAEDKEGVNNILNRKLHSILEE